MNAETPIKPSGLELLRVPFPAHQISKLPKPLKRDSQKGKCSECGGYHALPAVHLDYVGHAALTDRLLDADPAWSWEPLSYGPDGLPALDRNGGLWIKLTVAGVTRLGYGSADGKSGGDAIKELIGDALRNAAMRFGAALDLWHKGDLHLDDEEASGGQSEKREVSPQKPTKAKREPQHSALKTELRGFVHELNGCGDGNQLSGFLTTPDAIRIVSETREKLPYLWDGEDWPANVERPEEFVPLSELITRRQRECAAVTASYATA